MCILLVGCKTSLHSFIIPIRKSLQISGKSISEQYICTLLSCYFGQMVLWAMGFDLIFWSLISLGDYNNALPESDSLCWLQNISTLFHFPFCSHYQSLENLSVKVAIFPSCFGLNIFYFNSAIGLGKAKMLHEPYPMQNSITHTVTQNSRCSKNVFTSNGLWLVILRPNVSWWLFDTMYWL